MNKIITIAIFLLSLTQLFAQNQTDSIEIKKIIGTVYRQNGKNLTPGQILDITRSNAEAYKEMRMAKANYNVGLVFSCAGGFMIGWPIGGAIAGKKMDWTLFGIGVGVSVISIPFSIAYSKQTKNAVRIYNRGLKQSVMSSLDFRLGLTPDGVGVVMKF